MNFAFFDHVLLNSLYLYPCFFKCVYSGWHVRGFFKTLAWSIWLICIGLLFFIAQETYYQHRQSN